MSAEQKRRPIKLGVLISTLEGGMDGKTPRWTDIAAMGRAVEDLGFDSVWIGDRLLVEDSEEKSGLWEGTTMLAALAAETSRIEIGSLVLRSIYRSPVMVAKIADALDEISGGRFVLGIGTGTDPTELPRFGFPDSQPVGRFEEAIAIIHGLLHHGQLDFEGQHYRVRDCELRPRGPSPSGPPLLIPARAPRMQRIAARYADRWQSFVTYRKGDVEEAKQVREQMAAACRATGRDPASLPCSGLVLADVSGGKTSTVMDRNPVYGGPAISGSPEEIAQACRELADAGYSELDLWLTPNTVHGVELIARALEVLDRA